MSQLSVFWSHLGDMLKSNPVGIILQAIELVGSKPKVSKANGERFVGDKLTAHMLRCIRTDKQYAKEREALLDADYGADQLSEMADILDAAAAGIIAGK